MHTHGQTNALMICRENRVFCIDFETNFRNGPFFLRPAAEHFLRFPA